jgi:2'-hydroxyisoflavone reductase
MTDLRDVAGFAETLCRADLGGVWNVTGAARPLPEVLTTIAEVAGREVTFTPIPPATIAACGVQPWSDMPLMAPDDPGFRHFLDISIAKAEAAGLTCRPLAETLGPLLAWDRGRRDVPLGCGLSADAEAALLNEAASNR